MDKSVTKDFKIADRGVPNPTFQTKKEEIQKPETVQILQDRLRDSYIQYKETAQRCQITFKTKASNEQFSRLYYTPNIPFFEEPEKQKIFRKEFIQDVSKLPEPKPMVTIADILHADCVQTIGDYSNPQMTKLELIQYYSRRSAQLQHKKHKLIKRWANNYHTAQEVDQIHAEFDRQLNILQIEQDSITSRLMRLQPDDRYSQDNSNERPNPKTSSKEDVKDIESKLYKEAEKQTNDSALRQDDFTVYLRHQTYIDRINRGSKKLIQNIKWVSIEKRYEIWSDSRIMMHNYQTNYKQTRYNLMFEIANAIKSKLANIGISDEKGVTACTDRYVYNLKDNLISRTKQMLNTQKFKHFQPFMLFSGRTELKHYLEKLAREYGINETQIDLDQGQMFSYQLTTFFPSKFEKQIRAMTFDWEDTGPNADIQLIDRLTKSLQLNQDELLNQISKIAADQRTSSLLSALNVGKTGAFDLSLKDLTENELSKDQFTRHNLLRKLRQLEFFNLDESKVKLRKADWLEYVCWQPFVSVTVQRQNQFLSSPSNKLDNLLKSAIEFCDVNDSLIVNRIIEDSVKVHIQKIQDVQTRITQCMQASANVKGEFVKANGATRSLVEATNPAIARQMAKSLDPNLTEAQQNQINKYHDIPNIDSLPQNLTKAYYMLRVIKTRDYKIKLLAVLNYFRAIQRILALDTREFMTREKAYGDHSNIIDPHFGLNSKGISIHKTQSPAGPSEIFNTTYEPNYDTNPIKGKSVSLDPVTFKAFKVHNSFNPLVISTCPIVPKFHRSFGRPSVNEPVSKENEREKAHDQNTNFNRMQSMLTMRDHLNIDFETKEIYVTNEFGMPIVYYEALNDLAELEEELLKIGSFYINQYEFTIQNNEVMGGSSPFESARPTSLIDRAQMAIDLIEKEYNFQFSKVKLIEQYMEVYEHTVDPLESMRILQITVDLIVQRPRLNMEASMYCDSYQAEIEAIQEKTFLVGELIDMQKSIEYKENEDVNSYIEIKIRKLQECVDKYWDSVPAAEKERRVGSNEKVQQEDQVNNLDDLLRQKILESEKQEHFKNQQLFKIKQRHITEFANEQFNDFAEILGLPEVTMEQLYQRFDESEPIVIDALRENAFFQNMIEGYPQKLEKPIPNQQSVGQHTPNCNLVDFFESMQGVSKFNAALCQTFSDLEKETAPENGFAISSLEVCLLKKVRILLRQRLKIINDGGVDPEHLKGQDFLEEDFYLGNPDKLVYQMRQLHFQCHKDNIYKHSNPLVFSKLDTEVSISNFISFLIQSVKHFNFPRIKAKEVVGQIQKQGGAEEMQELLIPEVIKMAKISVARQNLSQFDKENFEDQNTEQENTEAKIFVPSILKMFCNITEIIRMREEIVMRMNECNILTRIYENQCKIAGKSVKHQLNEQIAFNTNQINGDNMNIVDLNDGMNLQFSPALPFMEYDRLLQANLDFKSNSCIQALFTDLGVEEIRAILHLQIAYQQLLTVAVKINTFLIDKPLRGLAELDLIEKKEITSPNCVVDLMGIMGVNTDTSNFGMIKSERYRMNHLLTKAITEYFFMITPKKTRERAILTKRFIQIQQRLISPEQSLKPELILRILRSYRLQLCYGYCQSIIQEVHKDSIKIQILETCNVLRLRASLLPKKSQIFRLGKSEMQENLSFEANNHLRKLKEYTHSEGVEMSINVLLDGKVLGGQTLFYIPSSEEICLIDRQREANRMKEHTSDHVSADQIDFVVKSLVKPPVFLKQSVYKIEGKQLYGVRKVWLEETQNLWQHEIYQILIFVTQILNIFDLEYTMLRNLAKSWQSQRLEMKVMTGRPFWSEVQQKSKSLETRQLQVHMQNEALIENQTSIKVIQYLDERKKNWVDLEQDLSSVSKKLKTIEKNILELPQEKRKLDYLCDILTLQHQSTFYTLLNGLENMIEYFLDKQHDDYFLKMMLVRDQLTGKNLHAINMIRSNGFYLQQSQISPQMINFEMSKYEEFQQFQMSQQTVIDERCLIPRQVTLIKSLFGQQSQNQQRDTKFGYQDILMSAFYNIDDDARAQMGANFTHVDEYINDYLVFKGLKENPQEPKKIIKGKDHFIEILLAQVEVLSLKIEASQIERVIMCWNQPFNTLPSTSREFTQVQRKFRDTHTMSILHERENLNNQFWQKIKKGQQNRNEMDQEQLGSRQIQQIYYSKINQLRAETFVIKNILEVNLIKIACDMVKNEHSALQTCFDTVIEDKQLAIYVHPSQQFASTPYSQVDKSPHLDVVTKVGFLQQFLTRLRNRCTEVETLTSGPGLVFSMKDFNDCLSIFARQLIKYGEEELRGRCETHNIKEYQYHHLIYIKQMETHYYRKKCDQLLENIENLTTARMMSQGNQMIYEIDTGARELQTLKDHYYVMEKCIRDEIRKDFNSELEDKQVQIRNLKEKFQQYRKEMSIELAGQISEEIINLETKIKAQIQNRQVAEITGVRAPRIEAAKVLIGQSETEHIHEIKELTEFIRKQNITYRLKVYLLKERQQKDLEEQKQKLSQSQNLWDQLAEAEKREQITQQELIIANKNLNNYERLIEKLYGQLEHLNNQKMRLQQYKKTKQKQITELESKMSDLEILESLDLNKMLEEIRQRDKKILVLDKVDANFNQRIEQLHQIHQTETEELKKALTKERSAKFEAFEKLDAMRIEMKTLEGKDSVKNDLWKDKCKELYEICRELELENDSLKTMVKDLNTQIQTKFEGQSNAHQLSTSDQSGFQPPLTREQIILQRKKLTQKPLTATTQQRKAQSKNMTVESQLNLDSLKISAEGYERRQLNTLRNQDGNKFTNQKASVAVSLNNNPVSTQMRKSYGPNHFMSSNLQLKVPNLQVSSMPQIKGIHQHFPALANINDQ